ncbi:MAG: [protein-PII] uridylyltransferase [Planctomycetaceae bacterium]
MDTRSPTSARSAETSLARRAQIEEIRARGRTLLAGGATGIQVAAFICEAMDRFLVEVLQASHGELSPSDFEVLKRHTALVAVGGTGRGELAPYSDADVLFLHESPASRIFNDRVAQVVRDYWDAGVKLGHSVRTIGESLSMAKQDPEAATALVEARLLWGGAELFEKLTRAFSRQVLKSRQRAFVDGCIEARSKERGQHGSTVQQLEPDIKRSPGGLRDVHLIRWLGASYYGTADIDSLRLRGALSREDARTLIAAQEFLMRIRVDLHYSAGRAQDMLTREEQLRISSERGIEPTIGQRPVERFMQTYFRHSTAIASIAERFAARHQPRSLISHAMRSLMSHRADNIFRVGHGHIDVVPRHRDSVCGSLEQVLRLYHTAALYGVDLDPELVERIKTLQPQLDGALTAECARRFVHILTRTGRVGSTLRGLYSTGVLELVIPNIAHARCLLQFNQYHSYTVDEHTLRAVEAAEKFDKDPGPVGTAYRSIRQKHLLHLAVLLHDLGKGFDKDHSDIGKVIAETVGVRLGLSDDERETVSFLVYKHLAMAHLAFRRDFTHPGTIMEFGRLVGSAERLRMLYVLTAADLTAVGPGVWTDWKSELLTDLFDRTMLLLSGKHYAFQEEERLRKIREAVRSSMESLDWASALPPASNWVDEQLRTLPAHYLSATDPEQIALDLRTVHLFREGEVVVEGIYAGETGTVDYRIITHESIVPGCFHKAAGALTAKGLEILSAQISTTRNGMVIDAFRVRDVDYAGTVPDMRIDEVKAAVRDALSGRAEIGQLFRKNRRIQTRGSTTPLSDLPNRVVIDSQSSDDYTVIDVFAHDRPGLLYTISRTLFELDLSVVLAKISTHLDQVVDVFYVADRNGRKVRDEERTREIQDMLLARLEEFQKTGDVDVAKIT